ncbi:MAG TPA: DNA repair protein RecN [Candidatus Gallimonas intestinavium]|uniref:DNA repair protein RecN n=1 Tax=Candidatus Gallimonas intestinavium TaxID=2838603 RepID=A0A9D2K056_9FIRM|nr:DNA repair protein RecN [Candidatus Gallimonas intestinavium]
MLRTLYLKNVALVDEAEIAFSEGLNVLSGETGAGKSVILDSIDFVLGAKADKGMIRSGQSECSVRAEFSCDPELLRPVLEELDLEESDTLLIVRRLNADGRSSLRVNGCPMTAAMLRKLTSRLVDVHGQSEHFFLLKEANQLRLLDQIAGTREAREKVGELLKERRVLQEKLSSLGGDEGERERRADILRFQIEELENAALKEGEEEELLALRAKYQNAEKILGGLKTVRDAILSDGGAADAVNTAHRGLLSIVRYGDYDALSERLENALAELEDIGETAESLAEELDIDEREAERVESRLDEIRSLKKKYGGSVEEALSFLARAREELSLLENSAEECEKLRERLENNSVLLYAACRKLTELRKAGAEGFTERVVGELRTLNIPSARFEIAFEPYSEEDLPRVNSDGLDRVRFLFSANAGEPPKELGKIISGGEMSRFMLAVKAQLSSLGSIGTYIFDEIDAGIGGKTARVVAEKFSAIARSTQIIAVSHLAQIAAFADREFLIEKQEEAGRTFSRIRLLGEEERREELVRLLGGDRSESALRHADELLESARAYKSETNGKPVGR